MGLLAISIIARNRIESHFQVRSVLPDPASALTFHFHLLLRLSAKEGMLTQKGTTARIPALMQSCTFLLQEHATTTTSKARSQLTMEKNANDQTNITKKEKHETDSFHDASKSSELHHPLQVINEYKC